MSRISASWKLEARSSHHRRYYVKRGVLKNFAKLTANHLNFLIKLRLLGVKPN